MMLKLGMALSVALGVAGWQFDVREIYRPQGVLSTSSQGLAYSKLDGALYDSMAVKFADRTEWQIRRSSDHGVNWETLYTKPVQLMRSRGFAFRRRGSIMVIAQSGSAEAGTRWNVLRGRGNGREWKMVEDAYAFFPGVSENYPYHIAVSPVSDRICVTGHVTDDSTYTQVKEYRWLVRCSDDDGDTWFNLDVETQGDSSSIAFDSKGNLFVAGSGLPNWPTSNRPRTLRLKRLKAGETQWSEIGVFEFPGNVGGAISAYVDSRDWIYVAGSGWEVPSPQERRWILRRSRDGGETWETLDRFRLELGAWSEAYAVAENAEGRIFVIGYAMDSGARYHAIVRTTGDLGATWTTALDEVGPNGMGIYGHNIVATKDGRVFISGGWYTPEGRFNLFGEVVPVRERSSGSSPRGQQRPDPDALRYIQTTSSARDPDSTCGTQCSHRAWYRA